MKKLIIRTLPVVDVLVAPFVYVAAWLLKNLRRAGVQRLPLCKRALLNVGVFPVRNHYYEPRFDYRDTATDSASLRGLPGIDWDVAGQLAMLERLTFASELQELVQHPTEAPEFSFDNDQFQAGDAEYWYQVIRAVKPKRIIEVGSGNSTLMAISAIGRNKQDDPGYACEHTCIEPYEMPWLEKTGVTVLRKKVETVELSFFSRLQEDDILFIDSSHIIRPEGDVLFEYLELLPLLNTGVIVHVHDIFSPRHYPEEWLRDRVWFWNEQYLLEAFLTHNESWKIIGALNYLHHNHYEKLRSVAPFLTPLRSPGSFYLQKTA